MVPRTILVVDDDENSAWTLGGLLKAHLGCQIHVCSSGAEAVDATSELRPDVVLLDIAMPGVDGMEVARLIHELFETSRMPKLIAITALDASWRHRLLQSGFSACVHKPILISDLLPLLELKQRSQPVQR